MESSYDRRNRKIKASLQEPSAIFFKAGSISTQKKDIDKNYLIETFTKKTDFHKANNQLMWNKKEMELEL